MPTSPMRWLYLPVLISQQRKWPCSLTTAVCALVDGTTAATMMAPITPVLFILTEVSMEKMMDEYYQRLAVEANQAALKHREDRIKALMNTGMTRGDAELFYIRTVIVTSK